MIFTVQRGCMGGFCHLREKCVHHMQSLNRNAPAERLCTPGQETVMFFKPAAARQP